MPSPLRPLFTQLPTELCDRIYTEAIDSRPDGERWLDVPSQKTGDVSLLRVLTQVNRAMRAATMPLIWTNISLQVIEGYDSENILGLRQLIRNLSTSGPLPGPKDYLQSIKFFIDIDCLWLSEDLPSSSGFYGSLARNARRVQLRRQLGFHKHIKSPQIVSLSVRELSYRLIGCPKLKSLCWTGWILPDPILLMNLSQCRSLKKLSVDLGSPEPSTLRYDWHLSESVNSSNMVPRFKRDFAFESVHFAVEPRFTGCPTCNDDGPLSNEINPRHGEAGVALLTAFRFTRKLVLGAPLLLYQRWMLPLWAQLERLEFDPDYREPFLREEPSLRDEERDPEMDEEMLRTAQVFPCLLDRNRRIRRLLYLKSVDVDKLAKAVFQLIHSSSQLHHWTYLFPKWDDLPYGRENDHDDDIHWNGFARTKSILRNVATVLVQRFKFTRVKRERYTTPAPTGYLIQRSESDRSDSYDSGDSPDSYAEDSSEESSEEDVMGQDDHDDDLSMEAEEDEGDHPVK